MGRLSLQTLTLFCILSFHFSIVIIQSELISEEFLDQNIAFGPESSLEKRQIKSPPLQSGPQGGIIDKPPQPVEWIEDAVPDTATEEQETEETEETEETTKQRRRTTKKPTKKPKPPNVEPPITLKQLLVTQSTLYAGCGKTRTCLSSPSGCSTMRKCRVAMSMTKGKTENTVKIAMAASVIQGYVAIGFSKDTFMDEDAVVSCIQSPTGPQVLLYQSYNYNYKNYLQKKHNDITQIAGFVQDNGVTACEFELKTNFKSENGTVFNLLDKSHHVMLSYGNHYAEKGKSHGELSKHTASVVSRESITLKEEFEKPRILSLHSRGLHIGHIIVSILVFSFGLPCSMFVAKYGRECFSHQMKCITKMMPMWLGAHLGININSAILSLIIILTMVIELGGVRSVTAIGIQHTIYGFIAIIAVYINICIGGFLYSKRMGFDGLRIGHWAIGQLIFCLGMFNLLSAPMMTRAMVPCHFGYIVALQIFVHIATHIFMSFHTYWLIGKTDHQFLMRRYAIGPMISFRRNHAWVVNRAKGEDLNNFPKWDEWGGRRRAVIFYVITTTICSGGLIFMCFFPAAICV